MTQAPNTDITGRTLFTVGPADIEEHVEQIRHLTWKLNVHCKMFDWAKPDVEQLRKDLKAGHCHALVALKANTNEMIGYLLYCYAHTNCSTTERWIGRYIIMEDLYVLDEHRRSGVGTALWAELAKVACTQNIIRIQWGVLIANKEAISFYKKYGAIDVHETERDLTYRLTDRNIHQLAQLAIGEQ